MWLARGRIGVSTVDYCQFISLSEINKLDHDLFVYLHSSDLFESSSVCDIFALFSISCVLFSCAIYDSAADFRFLRFRAIRKKCCLNIVLY